MSLNKDNPHAMLTLMDYIMQLATEPGDDEQRRNEQGGEENRNIRAIYSVPPMPSLSASTTSSSLSTFFDSQSALTPNNKAITSETESESSDEEFKRAIKIFRDKDWRKSVPFVKQLSIDTTKSMDEDLFSNIVYSSTSSYVYWPTQVFAALVVSLGSIVVGYSCGYSSPAFEKMQHGNSPVQVTKSWASWVVGVMPLTAMVGGVVGGTLIKRIGRRNTILTTAFPFIMAWLSIATANNVVMIVVGRAVSGFCVGVASLSFPIYLGEIMQPEVHGSIGLLSTIFSNIGILLIYIAGKYMDWTQLAYMGAVLPFPFLMLMLFIPETPRWCVSHNRPDRALRALRWLRGKDTCIDDELRDIQRFERRANRRDGVTLLTLFSRTYYRSVIISLGLMFFQQLTGINAVIFYTAQIFKMTGSTMDGDLVAIIIGIVNLFSLLIVIFFINRLRRKVLLYISATFMIFSLSFLGVFFFTRDVAGLEVQQISWLPILLCSIYILGFSLGFGPIPWIVMGEILPSKIRDLATSVAIGFSWLCTFVVTISFLDILNAIGAHGTFWLFAGMTFVGLSFVMFFVPETQNKSSHEIQNKLGGRVRRKRPVSHLKPLSFNM